MRVTVVATFETMNDVINLVRTILLVCYLSCAAIAGAQTITGNLSLLTRQPLRLEGFNGLRTYPISSTTIDEQGNFKLAYAEADRGVGYLISADEKPLFVILSGEDIELQGEALSQVETLRITKEQENQWFAQYAQEHPKREQALSAWVYLERIYRSDALFLVHERPAKAIEAEKQRIRDEDAAFLNTLPTESYVRWLLPARKLVSSVPTVAQHRPEEIPTTIAAFCALDYTDPRLYKSGLFKDAIESHFWLLENSGRPLDSVFLEMQLSIDAMLDNLARDERRLNEVTDHLFDLLERQSLNQASEYLALKVLNEVSCTIDSDLAKQLETYRAMKKGNRAADIDLTRGRVARGTREGKPPQRLSDLASGRVLVVFAAGWCPKCRTEVPEMAQLYPKWKAAGMDVLLISLDDDPESFAEFTSGLPFLSYCDLRKWESYPAKDYHVFGTPTMFLLDDKQTILLRPTSVNQVDAWVDWFLLEKR
jgi:thiol-disulfide isomerase/thioredoxin